jgi:hypothetical protein
LQHSEDDFCSDKELFLSRLRSIALARREDGEVRKGGEEEGGEVRKGGGAVR